MRTLRLKILSERRIFQVSSVVCSRVMFRSPASLLGVCINKVMISGEAQLDSFIVLEMLYGNVSYCITLYVCNLA